MKNGKSKTVNGLLLVDKPAGISSFGVVARVRGIIKNETGQKIKIGHTGTLDPAATGLMILVLGKYTKRAGEFSKLDKTYEAELTLGQTSTTGDKEGEITKVGDRGEGIGDSRPSKKALQDVLSTFVGQITQTPPAYSAIKIDGQRAYKLARQGKTPVIKPREITIYSLELTDYSYPKVKLTVSVSSGTYIRTLAEDIGTKLGTGAYLSALRRTEVGNYSLDRAIDIDKSSVSDIINYETQTAPAK